MKKVKGRIAIRSVLELMQEADHIPEELVRLIDEILSDYIYDKKLSHCLYTLIRFESNIVDIDKIKEALKELEDKEK